MTKPYKYMNDEKVC